MSWTLLSIISIVLSSSALSLDFFPKDVGVRDIKHEGMDGDNEEFPALEESRASIIGSAALTGFRTGEVNISAKILFYILAYIVVKYLVIGIIGIIVNFNIIIYVIFPLVCNIVENIINNYQ